MMAIALSSPGLVVYVAHFVFVQAQTYAAMCETAGREDNAARAIRVRHATPELLADSARRAELLHEIDQTTATGQTLVLVLGAEGLADAASPIAQALRVAQSRGVVRQYLEDEVDQKFNADYRAPSASVHLRVVRLQQELHESSAHGSRDVGPVTCTAASATLTRSERATLQNVLGHRQLNRREVCTSVLRAPQMQSKLVVVPYSTAKDAMEKLCRQTIAFHNSHDAQQPPTPTLDVRHPGTIVFCKEIKGKGASVENVITRHVCSRLRARASVCVHGWGVRGRGGCHAPCMHACHVRGL